MEIKIKDITIKLENLDNLDNAVISIGKDSNIASEEKGIVNIPLVDVTAENPNISSVKVTCNLKEDIYQRLKTFSKDHSTLNDEYLFNDIFDKYLSLRGY